MEERNGDAYEKAEQAADDEEGGGEGEEGEEAVEDEAAPTDEVPDDTVNAVRPEFTSPLVHPWNALPAPSSCLHIIPGMLRFSLSLASLLCDFPSSFFFRLPPLRPSPALIVTLPPLCRFCVRPKTSSVPSCTASQEVQPSLLFFPCVMSWFFMVLPDFYALSHGPRVSHDRPSQSFVGDTLF